MEQAIEVLIVEDDLRIAEIHRRFTEKVDGFKVIGTATTGEQAKDWLETVQPQLVLLDVYLPDMLGIDLVKMIRQQFGHIDIIMITAASEVEVVRQALHGGVVDYIVKPLTFDRFKNSLENYRLKAIQLSQNSTLTQEQIEGLWNSSTKLQQEEEVPKGIDPLTLEKLLESIRLTGNEGITAEELSKRSGVSRSTARRYLEYLILQKKIHAQLIYGNVGRPERRYFLL
ncbi:two-component system CitB family response regulator [Bacillus mesophilus]|uniref:Response regulator n=1 Tax=Bacillus mesophilus TaxID=1808955 RepID=A0A6M0Q4Z1_9BACI|nr:response regulator [Bacillus mesophilus]MBM7660008.1 two-component system CitB family response regulator [Bacillus mesophilus]NEY70869.1 response regulator [Bacillus mesophilus]